jgi:Domain of unknown function (DUF4386)
MDSNRMTAVTAGVLFIVATSASILGTQLSSPILTDLDYLTAISANPSLVSTGALLELFAAGACAAIAVSLYPLLRRWNARLALGSVVFRTIEAVMYVVGVVSLLSLVTLSQQFTAAAAAERAAIQAMAGSLLAVRQQTIVPAVFAFSVGALMYYYVLYRSRLIPRWLSGWGIGAIVLTIVACLLAWFSRNPLTTYTIILVPIAVQEMVFALWLIAKGFSASALQPRGSASDLVATAGPKSLSPTTSGVAS